MKSMTAVISLARRVLGRIVSSLKQTLSVLADSARHRNGGGFVGLAMEGSPLEGLVDNLLTTAFWIRALAPVLLIPIYYLAVSLA